MRKFKKIIGIILVVVVFIVNSQISITYANEKLNESDIEIGLKEENQVNENNRAVDTTPPKIKLETFKIDKKNPNPGDTVNLSVEATDDISGVKYIFVYYKMPITEKTKGIALEYDGDEKVYKGSLYVDENSAPGKWYIDYIYLCDNLQNELNIYSSEYDFSDISFNVESDENPINIIEDVTVVSNSQSIFNKNIDGDLYIGPQAVVTIGNNVTVTGNIYVLGALKINGGLTINGTLYGTSMSWGGNPTLYNGTIVMNGSNSIGAMNMSNYPVQDIPVRIDNEPLVAIDGIVNIKGATINVADIHIEDKKVELDYKGIFDLKNIDIGKKDKITIEFKTVFGNTIIKTYNVINDQKEEEKEELAQGILYKTHIEDYGWQNWKSNGEMSGTSGESKRLEGITIKTNDILPGASIKYRTHVQDYGWQEWKSNGEMSGTSGEAKRLEGIEIKLENAPGYSIEYRTHVQDYGWQEWKSNGEMSGTSGESKRLEGIEIRIVKDPKIEYRTHVQEYGWQDWKNDGEMSGTSGESKRLEGIEIKADNLPEGASIEYRTHVQDYGWQEWKSNGEMSGTSGESKKLEGIEIKLENAPGYSIEYRTHVQDYGWQEWKSNGEMSGTSGESKRLEGIEVRIIKK